MVASRKFHAELALNRTIPLCLLAVSFMLAIVATAVSLAQWQGRSSRFRSSRPMPDRSQYPNWQIDQGFESDVFTFVRVRYSSTDSSFGSSWRNDYPDCDWNFSYRLQQLTSLKVDPDGKVLDLTDPELFNYPFLYLSGAGGMSFHDDELQALRRYLLNGGFLMIDDFWARYHWEQVSGQMKKVFPDRSPVELTLDHEIFHLVYDLDELPQVPSIRAFLNGDTFEYWHGPTDGDEDPHFYAIHDDNRRIMALLCYNNDIGDGWEREGESLEYFKRYSERYSYPMGINIVTYALTH